jgi:hypothetical protein
MDAMSLLMVQSGLDHLLSEGKRGRIAIFSA